MPVCLPINAFWATRSQEAGNFFRVKILLTHNGALSRESWTTSHLFINTIQVHGDRKRLDD